LIVTATDLAKTLAKREPANVDPLAAWSTE
jgi:hypothetical protein